MKKLITLLMAVMLVAGICTCVASAEQIVAVDVNGVEVDFDVPAQVINDRTLVPLRGIFEVLGATVDWNNATETVTAKRGDIEISLAIGSTSLFVNGEEKTIDVPAQLVNDRTLIPARAVAESLGAAVDWNDAEQTVIIKDESAPDFAALLKKSEDAELEINSMDISGSLDFDMTVDYEKLSIDADLDMRMIVDPISYEMDMVFDVMGEKVAMQIYALPVDDKLEVYAVSDIGTGEKIIEKTTAEIPAGVKDTSAITSLVEEIFPESPVKVVAQEKVNDKEAVKYVYTITGAQLNALLKVTDTQQVLAESGIEELFAPDSRLKAYVWIETESAMSYKVSVDMLDTVLGLLDSMGMTEGYYLEKCSFDMVINGINNVEEITVPEDVVKNAVELASQPAA